MFIGGELEIAPKDLDNPYGAVLTQYLSREFPANLDQKTTILESVTAAIIASSKIRFGPTPGPESLVAIRKVIASSIEAGMPIPVLVPWGSKKPSNSSSIDIAELGGLRSLSCLENRVQRFYPPGLEVNLRVEDVGGYYLFADEGQAARVAGDRYVADFLKLINILGLFFVQVRLESDLMNEGAYVTLAEQIRPVLSQFITETDAHGFGGYADLESYQQLVRLGWTGSIPMEQRDYYRQRYARLYPGIDVREQTTKLATYLAG